MIIMPRLSSTPTLIRYALLMRVRAVVRAGIARHRWPPKIPRSIVNDVLEKSLYKHLHCREL